MEKNINEIYDFMVAETDSRTKKLLEDEIHRLYKIIIKHSKEYKKENAVFRKNYRKFLAGHGENKLQKIMNIGLVNEMKIVADKMDVDIHEVIAAAATKRREIGRASCRERV